MLMRRGLLITLLVALTVVYAVLNWPGNENALLIWLEQLSPADRPPADDTRVIDDLPTKLPIVSVLTVPPDKMRAALNGSYRLRPDKRFLHAVAEIHHLLTGQERTAVTVEFKDGIWLVHYGDTRVGALPEFPDFSDGLDMLELWAKLASLDHPLCLTGDEPGQPRAGANRARAVHPYWCRFPWHLRDKKPTPDQLDEITRQLDRFWAPDAAAAIRQVDSLWRDGVRDAALLKAATRALTYLNLQVLDRMETADLLAGKALAVLALTKVLTDLDVTREEALLAEAMEYTGYAERVGRSLPETDPVRPFASHEAPSLVRLAQAQYANTETRYLALLRIAELHRPELLEAWRATYFPQDWWSLPSLKVELELRDFVTNRVLAESMPRIVLLALAQEAGLPSLAQIAAKRRQANSHEELDAIMRSVEAILAVETSTLVDRFDSTLQVLTARYPGPFLDAEAYHAYFRAHFYSSLYILGLHYLDELSSAQAANKFAATLGESERRTGKQFQQWYRNLVQSESGKGDLPRLIEDLSRLPRFGAPPLFRTYDEQKKHFHYGDPALLYALKKLALRMDSRPDHRFKVGNEAFSGLHDLKLTKTFLRSAIEVDPWHHQWLEPWYSYFTGDHQRLLNLVRSPAVRLKVKADALEYMGKLVTMSSDNLRNEYRVLIAANPTAWALRAAYADYLEQRKEFAEARVIIEDWLSLHDESVGFDYLFALNRRAKMYYLDGRYQEGLGVLAPILAHQQGGSLQRATLILDKLGRPEDAEKMAVFLVKRYPDNIEFRTVLAEVHWRQGKYTEAAAVLKAHPYPLDWNDWKFTIGKSFIEAFGTRSAEAGSAAFAALIKSGIDQVYLHPLAEAVNMKGNHDLAFKMITQLHLGGYEDVYLQVTAYRFLKSGQGKVAALNWLRKTLSPEMIGAAGVQTFPHGEMELLWDLIEEPEKDAHSEFLWLLRAAAYLELGPDKDPHRETLLRHFQQAVPPDAESRRFHLVGRYLLGLEAEDKMFSLATDQSTRCEVAFYLGLRAEGEGRLEDASDWYRVAVETAANGNHEYDWALNKLHIWYGKEKSLSLLAARKSS